jgi:sugar phosphate isomerase/epimerase
LHPRVSLHQVAFLDESTATFIEHCERIGVRRVTLVTPLLMQPGGAEQAQQALAATGIQVESVNHPFATYPDLDNDAGAATEKLLAAIDIVAGLGARSIYLLTGGRVSLTWEQAAERFAALLAPGRVAAAERDLVILVENASSFNADLHIAHTLADTITLARVTGIGVCLDWHACWMEAGLADLIKDVLPNLGLVQVSDYVLGDRTAPCRAVPGDGAIPLERLMGEVLEAGYQGAFDIELLGPRIAEEGPRVATERAAQRVSEILDRLGA